MGPSRCDPQRKPVRFEFPLQSYVMEHILFKISYPAEFHAQTALEAAIQLHPILIGKFDQIEKIEIETQEPAIRIIDKSGTLNNPADRDHCLQYVVAIGLIYGALTADHYEDKTAENTLIQSLRNKMTVKENPSFSEGYYDPQKRSISNAITITFKDGTQTRRVEIEFPIGHKRRRREGIPLLYQNSTAILILIIQMILSKQSVQFGETRTIFQNNSFRTTRSIKITLKSIPPIE